MWNLSDYVLGTVIIWSHEVEIRVVISNKCKMFGSGETLMLVKDAYEVACTIIPQVSEHETRDLKMILRPWEWMVFDDCEHIVYMFVTVFFFDLYADP